MKKPELTQHYRKVCYYKRCNKDDNYMFEFF